jgi:hypothetical protein
MASAVLNIDPEGNLSRYLWEIRKFSLLAPEEEGALARHWRDGQDTEAMHKLVTSHLRQRDSSRANKSRVHPLTRHAADASEREVGDRFAR